MGICANRVPNKLRGDGVDDLSSRMKWETDTRQYAWGENLKVGKWTVGGAHNSGSRSKSEPKKWQATCLLPGMKSELGWFETVEEAKDRAEKAVTHWFGNLS